VAAGIGVEVAMRVLSCLLAELARNIVYGQFGPTILFAPYLCNHYLPSVYKGSALIIDLFN
jgi:hypothetical protein